LIPDGTVGSCSLGSVAQAKRPYNPCRFHSRAWGIWTGGCASCTSCEDRDCLTDCCHFQCLGFSFASLASSATLGAGCVYFGYYRRAYRSKASHGRSLPCLAARRHRRQTVHWARYWQRLRGLGSDSLDPLLKRLPASFARKSFTHMSHVFSQGSYEIRTLLCQSLQSHPVSLPLKAEVSGRARCQQLSQPWP